MLEVYMNILTEEGMKLHAKNCAGEKMEITRFAIGNGVYSGTESQAAIAKMTALKSQKNSYGVTKVEVVNSSTCLVTMVADNTNIAAGYYVTEVGVFAKGQDGREVLYSAIIAKPDKPDWMSAYNGATVGTLKYYDYISIGNASNVVLEVGGGGVALQEDLEAIERRVLNLERGAAACIGIRRKCADDKTPQSSTAWERWGQGVDAVVQYARGDEEVQNDLMKMWPYNLIRPCNLPLDAEEPVAYLGDPEFDWYGATGVAAGTSVMDEIPTEMYLAHWFESDESGQMWEYKCVADSGRYPGSTYVKDLMRRADGSTKQAFYFPIFLGSLNANGNYVSVAGANPKYNYSCSVARTAVKTNGNNWQLIDHWAWETFTELLEIMSADANFRKTYGSGCSGFGSTAFPVLKAASATNVITMSNTYESKFRVGMTVNVGTAIWNASVCQDRQITAIAASQTMENAIEITLDGTAFDVLETSMIWRCAQRTGATINMASPNGTAGANDGLHSVRTLYVEDLYGMLHTGVDGINLKFSQEKMGNEMYVCTNPSKYGDAYADYTLLPEVLALNVEEATAFDKSGWIKKEHYFEDYPIINMPAVVNEGAGSTTYLAAYCWNNRNGQRPFFGGSFHLGAGVSPRSRNCYFGFSYAYWAYGSRPLRR
ncbi:MAG: phage tail protein [Eubacteriales bacterium]|nr:phage tail protein [Eubacteriales bacterium]